MGPNCSDDPPPSNHFKLLDVCVMQGWRDRLQGTELTRSVWRCVSAASWEQSEDRSNNGPTISDLDTTVGTDQQGSWESGGAERRYSIVLSGRWG